MKSIGKNLGDIDKAFNYIFKELLSIEVLKKVIDEYKGIPEPRYSTKKELLKHITSYIRKNYPKENVNSKFVEFVMKSIDSSSLQKMLDEPSEEADLKPIIKNSLRERGFTP